MKKQMTEREMTVIIERHRIFGIFSAKGVLEASREIAEIECKNFLQFYFRGGNFDTVEGAWSAYSNNSNIQNIRV